MAQPIKNSKTIFDPLWGIIDITEFLPMIDVPEFQALGFKYQLGVTNMLFPAATHTRKQHSFGAFKRSKDLARRWYRHGFISEYEGKLIAAFGLWHDIGHGPFSHLVEEVTRELWSRDHDQNGALIIERLKDAVEAVGITFDDLQALFTHENPLYLAVHDKNLGAEKLDYLSRDAYYTIGETPDVEYLAHHTYFIDGQIVIDEKAIDNAKAVQDLYVKMYKTVYFRKNSAIAQRLIQKMTAKMLQAEPMTENDFWALTDFGLLGRFETSSDTMVQNLYRRFITRQLPRTAVALVLPQFAKLGRRHDKPQWVLGIDEGIMQALVDADDLMKPSGLETIGRHVEEIASLPEHSVLIVPPFSTNRFRPQDITIVRDDRQLSKLSDYYPDHFVALEEEGKSYMTLRVCTFEEHREKLSEKKTAEAVRDYLISLVK